MPFYQAGTETDADKRITPILETTVFDSRPDIVTPTLPEDQIGGYFYS